MKVVAGWSYVHLSAVGELHMKERMLVAEALHLAAKAGQGRPDVVACRETTVLMSWCDDFDGNPEPAILKSLACKDGKLGIPRISGDNPQVYHGKELMVDPHYKRFSRKLAAERRARYLELKPDPLRMGRKKWWTDWCTENGIEVTA